MLTTNFCFTGRATLQTWSLILYGTKSFAIVNLNEINTKVKPKKKTSKKQKISKNSSKNVFHSVKPPKTIARTSLIKSKKTQKTNNITTPIPFGGSPYFYAVSTNKYKTSEESVKPYLKFVKNITITYPVIIPARDNVKRKPLKQKEKSRDVNTDRNLNHFTSKPVPFRTTSRGKTAGNLL